MKIGDRVLDIASEEAGTITDTCDGHPIYAEDTRTFFGLRSEDTGQTLWRAEDELVTLEDL